jgi:hypothetical protein
MAMNQVDWMLRDVSAGNCLLARDPADGSTLILDMELAKKIERQAPASKTAISVSVSGSTNERCAYDVSQGTMHFMARKLLDSLSQQQDPDFVYLPQHDLESLVYVLAYAVMKKECVTKPVKSKSGTKAMREAKLGKMKENYHKAFTHSTVGGILAARQSFRGTWTEYLLIVAGNQEPSVLHEIIGTLLDQVDGQYVVPTTRRYRDFVDNSAVRTAVPLNDKRMRRLLKLGIADQKAHLKKTFPDSDFDTDYD